MSGVNSLSSIFPLRQGRLQFKPAFEEIKSKYFREMKKFISIPNHFGGVGEDAKTVFPAIIESNAGAFTTCYKKAHLLFRRLHAVQGQFKVCLLSIHSTCAGLIVTRIKQPFVIPE